MEFIAAPLCLFSQADAFGVTCVSYKAYTYLCVVPAKAETQPYTIVNIKQLGSPVRILRESRVNEKRKGEKFDAKTQRTLLKKKSLAQISCFFFILWHIVADKRKSD